MVWVEGVVGLWRGPLGVCANAERCGAERRGEARRGERARWVVERALGGYAYAERGSARTRRGAAWRARERAWGGGCCCGEG